MEIKSIAIAGAGTMGAGIAQVCAQADFNVILFDINEQMLTKAKTNIEQSLDKLCNSGKITQEHAKIVISHIQFQSDIKLVKADLIIEAIVEKLNIKVDLFIKLMELNGSKTIYASNTSSIPITQIASQLPFPSQFIGIHFFNPAQIMKLVEIIKGAKTEPLIVEIVYGLIQKLKKEPVIAADAPGFIVNRIARLYYVEALKILEEGVCDFNAIDSIMESSGFKMGPFKLMDLIGVDTNYSVTESQFELFNYEPRFRPSRIQKQKVDAGLHGRKSKEGFYKYE
ncbi:MAG: 3-hydroxyacyl-CoA dehydrogenase NAD-binding domain-containing protein [bacterium]|nr:3-hydroxyacyl-CoA dehydrogenase NAD-binding domain-containing protein [bacterium]